ELEQQMEAVKRGVLPESFRVNAFLPPHPVIFGYLSEEGLGKYDFDNSRALSAFNADNTEWLMKAQDARSFAVAEQGLKTQEFT
ncbi:scaffolding protein, partial [Salmonella enterica subsp. enterica serovar Typhimurium]